MILCRSTSITAQFSEINFFFYKQNKMPCDVRASLKQNLQSGKTDAKYSPSRKSDDIIFQRVQNNIPDPYLVTLKPKKRKKRELMLMRKQNNLQY